MKKSITSELNRYLKELDRNELENEVKKLYSKFDQVKKYYEMELSPDTSGILNEYKNKIKQEYFPNRGFGKARSGESRKIISEFKKISIFKKDVIELLLYRVEMMIEFSNAYGGIDEPFYNSLESSFKEACKTIQEEKLEQEYWAACRELIERTYSTGWGVSDGLEYIYEDYLGDLGI